MSLLTDSEPPPYKLILASEEPADGARGTHVQHPTVLCCDHASNRVPASLNGLRLNPDSLQRHIAIDIGAASLTQALALRLNAPAIFAEYSRLVVDLNRYPSDNGFIVASADGEDIPANQQLSADHAAQRRRELFDPYHSRLAEELRAQETLETHQTPTPCALICVHSFTPTLTTKPDHRRPWDIGLLWMDDDRLTQAMVRELKHYSELCVGLNEPYSGKKPLGYTAHFHAERLSRPYLLIEVRQDLIDQPSGVSRWADLLANCIYASLKDY